MTLRALATEIRRRHLFQAALLYAVVAVGVIEAADLLVPYLGLPDLVTRALVAVSFLGLPVALFLGWAYEWTPEGFRPTPRGGPFEEWFLLDEAVCRRLDRSRLDPRVVGDRMAWLDNRVRSRTLFIYLHGLGHDAGQFADILRAHPYRAVALTLYGFEADRETRIALGFEDHAELVRAFVAYVVGRLRPAAVVLVGFSAGADLALRAAARRPPGDPAIDGLLALGPNLGPSTLFASRLFARLGEDDDGDLPRTLAELGAGAADLDEWLNAHEYLVRVLRRFEHDLGLLRDFARGLLRLYDRADEAGFIAQYLAASRNVGALLCVAADTEAERAPIERVRLLNMDRGVLGDRFRPGSLRVEPGADHFELIDPDRHRAQVDELLRLMAEPAPGGTFHTATPVISGNA